ncbi:hypothetical protein FKM82_029099, partial [Ascaphus truei]
ALSAPSHIPCTPSPPFSLLTWTSDVTCRNTPEVVTMVTHHVIIRPLSSKSLEPHTDWLHPLPRPLCITGCCVGVPETSHRPSCYSQSCTVLLNNVLSGRTETLGDGCRSGEMAFQSMQKLLECNSGSLVTFQVNKDSELDSINFQTSLMTKVMMQFPEVLLLLRIHNAKGKALYIFIADGPRLKTTCEMTKLVHIAVPKNETPKGLARMFHTMKNFNPNWTEIRTFLVDPPFQGGDAIAKAFPSSEVVLSVLHVCKSFQNKISQLPLSHQTGLLLVNALKNTMCSATADNLRKMHTILQEFVRPGWLKQLHLEWLLVNRIWALHRWRSWSECGVYFENMETLNREFGHVFNEGLSLESTITKLAKLIQEGTVNKPVP